MECVPFEESAIGDYQSRFAWDAVAAELVGTALDRWHLEAGEAFVGGAAACVLRVTRSDGSPAVLKVGYPHVEGIWEAVGLEVCAGIAPAVLRQDPWTWTMLLEDISPGLPLSRAAMPAERAIEIGASVHLELSSRRVPDGLPPLAVAMDEYARNTEHRMPGQAAALDALGVRALVERAVHELRALATTSEDVALLHGDFNPGNLLQSGADRWVVIDPKPMRGEPEFDLWPLVTQLGSPWSNPHPERVLSAQLEAAASIARCDPHRAARWAFARTGINISWYIEEGQRAAAETEAAALRIWERVLAA